MLCSTELCNTAWEPGLVGVLVNKRCCHVKRTFKDKQLAFRVRLLTLQIFTSGGHPQQTPAPQKCTCAFLISHHLENAGTHKSSATNSKLSCISLLVSPCTLAFGEFQGCNKAGLVWLVLCASGDTFDHVTCHAESVTCLIRSQQVEFSKYSLSDSVTSGSTYPNGFFCSTWFNILTTCIRYTVALDISASYKGLIDIGCWVTLSQQSKCRVE